jgi:hypothetical protein
LWSVFIDKQLQKPILPPRKRKFLSKEGRGSHFDPDEVDAFFAIQDEILTIKKRYNDDNQQAFDIPELKSLLQQYNHIGGSLKQSGKEY